MDSVASGQEPSEEATKLVTATVGQTGSGVMASAGSLNHDRVVGARVHLRLALVFVLSHSNCPHWQAQLGERVAKLHRNGRRA